MEAYTHNPFEEVRPWAQFFNILLFELFGVDLCQCDRKDTKRASDRAGNRDDLWNRKCLCGPFRTNPIVPWDIFFLEDGGKCGI